MEPIRSFDGTVIEVSAESNYFKFVDGEIIATSYEWAKANKMGVVTVGLDKVGDTTLFSCFTGVESTFNKEGEPLMFESVLFVGQGKSMEIFTTIPARNHDECIRLHKIILQALNEEVR